LIEGHNDSLSQWRSGQRRTDCFDAVPGGNSQYGGHIRFSLCRQRLYFRKEIL
jgi:hypothetical protein